MGGFDQWQKGPDRRGSISRQPPDEPLHTTIELRAVRSGDRLPNSYGGSRPLVNTQSQREPQLLLYFIGQGLGDSEQEFLTFDFQGHPHVLYGAIPRHQRKNRIRGA